MEEIKNTPQPNSRKGALEIELTVLFRDFLRSFSKLWWQAVLLAVFTPQSPLPPGPWCAPLWASSWASLPCFAGRTKPSM